LAVVIVVITLIGAAIHEVVKRREIVRTKMAADVATGRRKTVAAQKPWFADPAFIMIFLIVIAGAGTAFMAGTMGVEECREAAAEQKQEAQEQKTTEKENRTGTENFNSIFSTDNLAPTEPEEEEQNKSDDTKEPRTGTENFNSIFSTDNLAPAEPEPESSNEVEEPRTGTENFNSIFSTDNLKPTESDN